jgi:hypothetical protein
VLTARSWRPLWRWAAERGTFSLELGYALVQWMDGYVIAGESDITAAKAVGQGLGNALSLGDG